MEIRHFKLVKVAADEGTLTKASEKLFISQSALSHQLREVETRIGSPVFLRLTKRLVLTDIGQLVYNTATKILATIEHSESELRKTLKGETGRIRLSTQCYTCYYWLPGVMKRFMAIHPSIDIIVKDHGVTSLQDQVLNGKLEVAIVSTMIRNSKIDYCKLFDDEFVVIVSPLSSLAKKKYIYPKDFKGTTLITHNKNFQSSFLHTKVLAVEKVKPEKLIFMQFTGAVIEMVKAGLGIAAMPKWAARNQIKNKSVVAIPITRKGLWRSWYAASLNVESKPTFITEFIRELSNNHSFINGA